MWWWIELVIGPEEQYLREMSLNVISHLTICVKREIRNDNFSSFIVILSEKLVNFSVISGEIAEIRWIWRKQEFAT